MNEGGGLLILWILLPVFAAVGIYLIWYSRRRGRMMKSFADSHRFLIRPESAPRLERTLNETFSLESDGLVRNFGQVSSVVEGGDVQLFRAVELLDLDPHARSQNTHFSRIGAVFGLPGNEGQEYIRLDRSFDAQPALPGSEPPGGEFVDTVRRAVQSNAGRHTLSVTVADGHGLIYFEPLVTAGENANDVEALYRIAQTLRGELAERR